MKTLNIKQESENVHTIRICGFYIYIETSLNGVHRMTCKDIDIKDRFLSASSIGKAGREAVGIVHMKMLRLIDDYNGFIETVLSDGGENKPRVYGDKGDGEHE